MDRTPFWRKPSNRSRAAWLVLRVLIACLIAAHGWVRLTDGGVAHFGQWLASQGLPMGFAIAAAVTAVEVLGTPVFALGKFVPALSVIYSSIYAAGIALVHAPAGWFVVGKGRNGVEYSVLLIVCLLCVGLRSQREA